jgi:DNA-3-methyladenine glycosylase
MLAQSFFNRDPCKVAQSLLGKVIRHYYKNTWLAARIIETEAYYIDEKGSHSSLGFTDKRKAMFMPAGTIYMYYARGGDSLNISVKGKGNAVLIKSAFPHFDELSPTTNLYIMQKLNPVKGSGNTRPMENLCAGQTLLCSSLALKVNEWDQKAFDPQHFYIKDTGNIVSKIIQTTRLGIPSDRDAHLMYRFIDYDFTKYCTNNPLSKRNYVDGIDYRLLGY